MLSLVESQTSIQQRQVFLVDRLDKGGGQRTVMSHMKAIVFLRPTAENVMHLRNELQRPAYGEYHVFFSNVVRPSFLEELAEADEFCLVRQVQEVFGDFFTPNGDIFTLEEPCRYTATESRDLTLSTAMKDRCTEGVVALLLALRRMPAIRYSKSSTTTRRLAELVGSRIDAERGALFDFQRAPDPSSLLLVLDRRDDPVTPLLNQWTYQAMVHELIGISRNRVTMPKASKPELREVVLSAEEDTFFRENMFLNFGDLGENMKQLVDTFQKKTKSKQNIDSIEDMKRFVESFPEFRQLSGNVEKHVALVGQLSEAVAKENLMAVSELEQEVACGSSGVAAQFKQMQEVIQNPRTRQRARLRLALLFVLRHEAELQAAPDQLDRLKDLLFESGCEAHDIGLLRAVTDYGGQRARAPGLFGTLESGGGALGAKFGLGALRRGLQGLQGIENVYTQVRRRHPRGRVRVRAGETCARFCRPLQHKPLLAKTLEDVFSRVGPKDGLYPLLQGGGVGHGRGGGRDVKIGRAHV